MTANTEPQLPTIILVDGIHGIHTVQFLLQNYKDNLYVDQLPDYYERVSDLIDIDNPENTDYDDFEDAICKGIVYVRNDHDGRYYSVAFSDGDIIAIHPDAEWNDFLGYYELPQKQEG